jgi:hypothetical protein
VRLRVPITTAILLACLCGVTHATETLDQFADGLDPSYAFYQPRGCPSAGVKAAAQTFTAGLTGMLTRVELALGKPYWVSDTGSMIIEIHGGDPSGPLLGASAPVFASGIPFDPDLVWQGFTFAIPVPLVAGQVYAIVLPPDPSTDAQYDPTFLWHFTPGDTYAAGVTWDAYCTGSLLPWQAYVFGTDRTFRTWMTLDATPAKAGSWGSVKQRYR